MARSLTPGPDFSARLSFWMLVAFLIILWFAGGASRADVVGQTITRFSSWTLLAVFAFLSPRLDWRRARPVIVVLGSTLLLVALQLVPLPPGLWADLPGREMFLQAAEVSAQPQPWRPLSISPNATVNALGSLIVPVTVLVLCVNLTRDQQWQLATIILLLMLAGCFLALLQFSGAQFNNPLINYIKGEASGNFANRNHFALFCCMGCVLVLTLGFRGQQTARWKAIAAITLLLFFLLIVFATGSRTGLLLACIAIVLGLLLVQKQVQSALRSLPRLVAISLVIGTSFILISTVALSIYLGRAISVNRAFDLDSAGDLRTKALPFGLDAIAHYFPAGSGFGTFDPVYRIIEPDRLLQPAYFNHLHNDWLEIILDGGIFGLVVLIGALIWSVAAVWRSWNDRKGAPLARAGFCMLWLILLASLTDYPARTPMIMALLVIAAIWLVPPRNLIQDEANGI